MEQELFVVRTITDWWMFGAAMFSGVLSVFAIIYTEYRTAKRFKKEKEPNLCFVLEKEFDPEPETTGIKTNPSGYRIICQNIGQIPVFIETIELSFEGNGTCLICPADDQYTLAVRPFETRVFPVNCQEFNNICYHSKDMKKDICAVHVHIAGAKPYEATMDIGGVQFMNRMCEGVREDFEVTP